MINIRFTFKAAILAASALMLTCAHAEGDKPSELKLGITTFLSGPA